VRDRGDPAAACFNRYFAMIQAAIAGLGHWGYNLVEASLGYHRLKIVHAVELDIDGARGFCAEHHLDLTDRLVPVLTDTTITATPRGSAEVLNEVTLILHKSGSGPKRTIYPAMCCAELDAFAGTIEKNRPFHFPGPMCWRHCRYSRPRCSR
jgi:hypothetical protein